MKFFTLVAFAGMVVVIGSGCASIVSKSKWPVTIHSEPQGANITITDKRGVEVYSGSTPATMNLKSGAGFFSKQTYTVTFKLDGYQTKTAEIKSTINGWYFGNILFGGAIGLLIIDPVTGAMWKIKNDFVEEKLVSGSSTSAGTPRASTLRILERSQISEEMAQHLVRVN